MLADQQRAFDDILAQGGEDIVYNGSPLRAIVKYGAERGVQPGNAVADECTITARRSAVAVHAKGTPVTIDGEPWSVHSRINRTPVAIVLKLTGKQAAPLRRSL